MCVYRPLCNPSPPPCLLLLHFGMSASTQSRAVEGDKRDVQNNPSLSITCQKVLLLIRQRCTSNYLKVSDSPKLLPENRLRCTAHTNCTALHFLSHTLHLHCICTALHCDPSHTHTAFTLHCNPSLTLLHCLHKLHKP